VTLLRDMTLTNSCTIIKFHENPSSGSRDVPYRQGRHGKTNSPFSQLCERAQKRPPRNEMFDIKTDDTKHNTRGTAGAMQTAVHVSRQAVLTWPCCVLPQGSLRGTEYLRALRSPFGFKQAQTT
jgi:hypothetical protein